MKKDINNLISITEANQNFSKVARMVDGNGAEEAAKYLMKYSKAFEELAK